MSREPSSYLFAIYLINPVLSVTLDGRILGGWVFAVDFTRGVISVTKRARFPTG